MIRRPLKVAVVHNFLTPYRIPVFKALLNDPRLQTMIFLTGSPGRYRESWNSNAFEDDSRIVKLPSIEIPTNEKSGDKRLLNLRVGRITKWGPDVVLVYGFRDPTNIIACIHCMYSKTPYVLFSEISWTWGANAISMVSRPLVQFIVNHASALGPASQSCSECFRSLGADPKKIIVVPCVPDVTGLAEDREKLRPRRNEIREKNGLEGRMVVLFIGRLEKSKGIIELLDAMDGLTDDFPDMTLLIVGNGPLRCDVERRAGMHPHNVKVLGHVPDEKLRELLSISDIHVMPSHHEAFGVVCAEALAFGVPSIVTSTSGCVDLITDNVNGYIIKPGEPNEIVSVLKRIANDRTRLGEMKERSQLSIEHLTTAKIYEGVFELITMAANRRNDGK